MSKTAQNYFKSLLVKNKKLIALYTFVLFIMCPLIVIIGVESQAREAGALFYQIIMIAAVIIVPIMSFKFNTNKKSVDTYYSLPISRKELFICHYFAPLIAIYVPMFLCFLLGHVITEIKTAPLWRDKTFYDSVIPLISFAEIMLVNVAQYSISTWAVNKANSFLDSALIALGYAVAPYAFFLAGEILLSDQLVNTGIGINIQPILQLFSPIWISSSKIDNMQGLGIMNNEGIMWILFHIVMAVVIGYFAYREFKKRKGEDAEQITSNFWTYPFLIHLASICIVSTFDFIAYHLIDTLLYLAISFTIFMIMNFVAKRSFKFDWKMIVRYAVIVLFFTGFRYAAKQTYFFGINKQHVDMSDIDTVVVNIRYTDEINATNESYIYKDYEGSKIIQLKNASPSDTEKVEELQSLQDLAAEQFKNDNYRYQYRIDDDEKYYWINVYYMKKGEIGRHLEEVPGHIVEADRSYGFYEKDIEQVLEGIEFELLYDSSAQVSEG